MNLRRDRTHQMGASNLTYHPEPQTPDQKRSTRISFTSLKKGKKATDVIDNKQGNRNILSPIATTQDMYKSAGKLLHSKTLVGYPRFAQLEEMEKRKLVFTGESFLIYDKVLEKYRDIEAEIDSPVNEQAPTKENLAKEKHNVYGTAAQETQLVGYDKHSADTLKNNVNLEKIREARRVLRRRYASRKNMYSIYNAWDEDNKGVVSIDDVYNMSKKLGLNLNVDEARVLLASANKSGTGVLALDEFLDLIYNKDDVLNVDLDKLADNLLSTDYLVKREELERGDDNFLRKLEEDAKKTREIKHMNQTNLILKNHLHEINMNFLEVDPAHAGYVNYEKFEEVIKKLAINENVVSGNDIKSLFEKHKSDGHTINYKDFIKMLKDFVFLYEDAYKEQKPSIRRAQSINTLNEKEDTEFHIVDCRTLPYHSIIEYWGRTKKVNRAIKRFFPNKKDFYAYLGGALHVDKGQVAERYVNGKELKNLVDGLFHNFDDGEVEKRDFEGFLSSCVYNNHGDTNLGEVAKLIYDEEESEFFHKINFKKKGPGPRKDNETENNGTLETVDDMKSVKFDTEEKRTLVELPSIGNSGWNRDEGLDKLLQKVDNTFFVGTKKAYDAFKAFDMDKDGYISRKDLAKKLQDLAIMSPEEGQRVLDYVDPENKGYVNFQEFSSKIRPNMVQQDEKGGYTTLPFVTSSKEAFQRSAKTIPHTTEKVKRMKAAVDPDNVEQKPKTRYNANPSWTNTFLTFQANSKSPMFVTEAERFNRDPKARIGFQHEAFQKKKEFEDGRLQNKQKFAAFFSDRVAKETFALDTLEENRRAKKYMQQVRYEQRAKLFNSYV